MYQTYLKLGYYYVMFKYVIYALKVSIFLNVYFTLMSPDDPSFKTTVGWSPILSSPFQSCYVGLTVIIDFESLCCNIHI
jgi:hypothetical protein